MNMMGVVLCNRDLSRDHSRERSGMGQSQERTRQIASMQYASGRELGSMWCNPKFRRPVSDCMGSRENEAPSIHGFAVHV